MKRPFTQVVDQPMLEVLKFLRANGFATFIVSGGGVEFMRVFAEDVYGVPPHQVIGCLLVHHTDKEREFAYDRRHVLSGQLDRGLDDAEIYDWLLVDMQRDWATIFPPLVQGATN